MSLLNDILKLTKRLYPTGRAFRIPKNSALEAIHKALAQTELEAYEAALSVLDGILPDNDNFTTDDATDWEGRLAIRVNTSTPLADRKLAIARKYASPGDIPARQHRDYLQGQLRAAGFDVYVHENTLFQPPEDYSNDPITYGGLQHGDAQHGDADHGGYILNKIANYVSEDEDRFFAVTPTYRQTFFVGAEIEGDWANVLAVRKDEFRQLILQLKPCSAVGFLLINYV